MPQRASPSFQIKAPLQEWGGDIPPTLLPEHPLDKTYEVPRKTPGYDGFNRLVDAHMALLRRRFPHLSDMDLLARLPISNGSRAKAQATNLYFLDGFQSYDRFALSGMDRDNPHFIKGIADAVFTVPDETGYYFGSADIGIQDQHIKKLCDFIDGGIYAEIGIASGWKTNELLNSLKQNGCHPAYIYLNDQFPDSLAHAFKMISTQQQWSMPTVGATAEKMDVKGTDATHLFALYAQMQSHRELHDIDDEDVAENIVRNAIPVPGDAFEANTWKTTDRVNSAVIKKMMRDEDIEVIIPEKNPKSQWVVITQGAWFFNNADDKEIKRRMETRRNGLFRPGTIFIDAIDFTLGPALEAAYDNYFYHQFIFNSGIHHLSDHLPDGYDPRNWDVRILFRHAAKQSIIQPTIYSLNNQIMSPFEVIKKDNRATIRRIEKAYRMELIREFPYHSKKLHGVDFVWRVTRSMDAPKPYPGITL